MTNEIKLLRAFIEASGFDVEAIAKHDDVAYLKDLNNWGQDIRNKNRRKPKESNYNYTDYKVTKKEDDK